MVGNYPVLDIGAADGALSFFFESLGYRVHAIDHCGTNMNRMEGIRLLARHLRSGVEIDDIDLDSQFQLRGKYGLTLLLGILYHLKNPFYVLQQLAGVTRYCLLSTRVARFSGDRSISLEDLPVAYLLDEGECNSDLTNYWIFSPAGLKRLTKRTGWDVCAVANAGSPVSDPKTHQGDERAFLLLRSARAGSVSAPAF